MAVDPKVTLKIPRPLYEQLGKIIEGSGFRSVNEFIVYVLSDLVSLKGEGTRKEEGLTKDEVEAIKRRLKQLGYF